jgi:hypothetical protein
MNIQFEELRRLIREQLKIATGVMATPGRGTGLFAAEFIPAGGLVFRWVDGFDKKYSIDYPMTLPPVEKKRFEDLASSDGNAWYIAGDDGAYFNHSSNPNVIVIKNNGPSATWDRIAARDINPGEELTMDYGDIGIDPI